ncbi:hypothetical protein T439DRAFT_324345 [Meredithblackwellia eburnea MCA 4105]
MTSTPSSTPHLPPIATPATSNLSTKQNNNRNRSRITPDNNQRNHQQQQLEQSSSHSNGPRERAKGSRGRGQEHWRGASLSRGASTSSGAHNPTRTPGSGHQQPTPNVSFRSLSTSSSNPTSSPSGAHPTPTSQVVQLLHSLDLNTIGNSNQEDVGRRLDSGEGPARATTASPSHRKKWPKKKKVYEEHESSADESGPLLNKIRRRTLGEEVVALFEAQKASTSALDARKHLIEKLALIINNEPLKWGHPHSPRQNPVLVEPFGSVRFGLSTSTSDLDLCIFDPYRQNGFDEKFYRTATGASEQLPDVYDMNRIAKLLTRNGFKQVRPVPFASVPIVKFTAELDGETISVDINTNERLGVLNSRLINAYCDLHPFVRPLSVFVKFWARQRELNDPSGQKGAISFSSYTYILLVISYLQSISLLPNLQDPFLISVAQVEPRRFWTRPRAGGRKGHHTITPGTGWNVTFIEKIPENLDWKVDDNVTFESVVKGFFQYYIDFDAERQVVSIQNGGPMHRKLNFGVTKPIAKNKSPTPEKASLTTPSGTVEEGQGTKSGEVEEDSEARSSLGEEEAEDEGKAKLIEDPSTIPPEAEVPVPTETDSTPEVVTTATKSKKERKREAALRPFGSRSSSPMPFEEFEEPPMWMTSKLIVQDPFILTRNTAGNTAPYVVDELIKEMRRALAMIEDNKSLADVCASIKNEAGFQSLAAKRHAERRKQNGQLPPAAKKRKRKGIAQEDGKEGKKEEQSEQNAPVEDKSGSP